MNAYTQNTGGAVHKKRKAAAMGQEKSPFQKRLLMIKKSKNNKNRGRQFKKEEIRVGGGNGSNKQYWTDKTNID